MTVQIRLPEMLRRYAGGAETLEAEGDDVRAALESVFARHPDLRARIVDPAGRLYPYFVLTRNDRELPRDGALDATVSRGDVIDVIGAAEGG
jgi:hypothetical protein